MAVKRIGPANANRLLDYEFADGVYLSLHDDDPGETGLNEIATDRVFVDSWSVAASKALHNVNDVLFLDLPGCTISYLGMWDSATGGNFLRSTPRLVGSPLVHTPLVVTAGDGVKLPATTVVAQFSNITV